MPTHQNHANEVQKELVKLGVITSDSNMISYKQIVGGGSANSIYEMIFENPSISFIQKVNTYNEDQDVRHEYTNQKILFENYINVPQPFFMKLTPNSRDNPYLVMEKVVGPRLVDVKEENPSQYEHLIEKLLLELFKIHNLNTKLFPKLLFPDIQENPFTLIDRKLHLINLYLERYLEDLEELIPVVKWLERNKESYPCERLVIVHGDYHSFNIIVQENQELKILDWTGIKISDFRMDVAYTATTESYTKEDGLSAKRRMKNVELIKNKYEQISGVKVEGISYFMILTCMFNLVRLYSQINNPEITGENEVTKDFFRSVYDYFLFLVDQIKEYFSEKN